MKITDIIKEAPDIEPKTHQHKQNQLKQQQRLQKNNETPKKRYDETVDIGGGTQMRFTLDYMEDIPSYVFGGELVLNGEGVVAFYAYLDVEMLAVMHGADKIKVAYDQFFDKNSRKRLMNKKNGEIIATEILEKLCLHFGID